jgi:uncharacterized membrane protein
MQSHNASLSSHKRGATLRIKYNLNAMAYINMTPMFTLLWILLSTLSETLGQPDTFQDEIEESWSWLSGGVSFFITGFLINIIMILLLLVACSIADNLQKRESGQITNNAL